MNSLLIFKCPMSHGTMKYTLCLLFCFDDLSLTLFVLTPSRFLNNDGSKILKLIVRVRIYHTLIFI